MKNTIVGLIVASLLSISAVLAENAEVLPKEPEASLDPPKILLAEPDAASDWRFSGNLVYSSRPFAGSFISTGLGGMVATGDSMNLGTSDAMMLALGIRYKRFGVILNYMPTSYHGQGTAMIGAVGPGGGGVIKETPLDTKIDVDMLLANVYYNLIQTPTSVFGVGFGFGQTVIDLNLTPEEGTPILYQGTQPFGFLNMHMSSRYKRFLYGFNINAISAEFEGVQVTYSDYKIDLGYRLIDKRVKFDIVGGYRLVNFYVDVEYSGGEVVSNIGLEGPFLGVTVAY